MKLFAIIALMATCFFSGYAVRDQLGEPKKPPEVKASIPIPIPQVVAIHQDTIIPRPRGPYRVKISGLDPDDPSDAMFIGVLQNINKTGYLPPKNTIAYTVYEEYMFFQSLKYK